MSDSEIHDPRVAMIQDGARLHYLVPLALQRADILDRVFIDWFVRTGSLEEKIAALGSKFHPQLVRKMAERKCPELDTSRVIRNPAMALRLRLRMRKFTLPEDAYIWASRQTAKWIIRQGFGHANALYGFIRNAAPEAFEAARKKGLRTIGDQMIAPLEIEVAEMQRQVRAWPNWIHRETLNLHQEYLNFERRTWETLDGMTCASDYVRDGLISMGIAPERVSVLPYPTTEPQSSAMDRSGRSGPLHVGFVGAVGLRKGAPWFLETAKRFKPGQVRFTMVGNMMLEPSRLESYSQYVQFVGPVPRSEVSRWLEKFDVFFFPSTCEGSAGAVTEAMAAGLPVITTINSGSRVRDGIEGFIRSYEDIGGFADVIARYSDDRNLTLTMGSAARKRVREYDLHSYQSELRRVFDRLLG
jgi:glycosyltransferase involved in cell wall biosynthesis